jgi:hypothetical protein
VVAVHSRIGSGMVQTLLPVGMWRGKERHVLLCLALSDQLAIGLNDGYFRILVRRYGRKRSRNQIAECHVDK